MLADFMEFQTSSNPENDDLPLFLSAKLIAQTLGISLSSAYELMHDKDFPALRIGSRIIVPKEDLRKWVADNTKGVQN